MTEFLIVAVLFVLMSTLLLIIPLLPVKKNKSLGLLIFCILAIPLSTLLLYQQWGNYDAMRSAAMLTQKTSSTWPDLLNTLERALSKQPSNYRAWYILGDSWLQNQEYEKAEYALKNVLRITNRATEPLATYTQVRFLIKKNQVDEEIESLLAEVLLKDPNNISMLGMKGISLFQKNQYQGAIDIWKTLLSLAESEQQKNTFQLAIKKAESLMIP